MNSIDPSPASRSWTLTRLDGAVELGHVTPGDDQRIAVGPPEDPARLRRIEIVEHRRDPRRSGQEPRDVPIGAGVILGDEGDVAVGIEKGLGVSARVERKGERQRNPRAGIVAQGNLVADAAQKRARRRAGRRSRPTRSAQRETPRDRKSNAFGGSTRSPSSRIDRDLPDVLGGRGGTECRGLGPAFGGPARGRSLMLPELLVDAAAPCPAVVSDVRFRRGGRTLAQDGRLEWDAAGGDCRRRR